MPVYGARERPFRAARIREQPRPPDTISTALTVQVIICVLALLCMIGMKKLDHEGYIEIKAAYDSMLVDEDHTEKALERFSDIQDIISGLYGRIKGYISGADNEIFEQPQMPGADAENEPDTPAMEPAPEQEFKLVTPYNYLEAGESVYAAESDSEIQPPSAVAAMSPVYLGAKIKPPVSGMITSGFAHRIHPMTGESDFHTGLDIAAEEGRPILAALPGEVVEVGYNETYGNYIVLQHAINLKTSYSHCSEIIAKEGMAVRQGERIALVGETGAATGPHLHFSVIIEGEFADPEWVLKDYIRLVE